MNSENLIHIKLEYKGALQAKKDIISSQIALLKVARRIKRYQIYRSEELELKLKLLKKTRELKTNIGKLQRIMPKPKIPAILKKEEHVQKEEKEQTGLKYHEGDLEEQLQEIQRKLNELQNKEV